MAGGLFFLGHWMLSHFLRYFLQEFLLEKLKFNLTGCFSFRPIPSLELQFGRFDNIK